MLLSLLGGLALGACGDTNANCPLDLSVTGGKNCGTNTTTSADGKSCVAAAGACGTGTTFNAATSTCQVGAKNYGTMIYSTPYNVTVGASFGTISGDASAVTPCGDNSKINSGVCPDNTKVFMLGGPPVGGNSMFATFYSGNSGMVPNVNSTQLTIADWKTCSGTLQIFKNPPSGKKTYNIWIHMQGCPANTMYTVWFVYQTDDKFENAIGATTPGLPAAVVVGPDGTADWVREIDPNVYTKFGQAIIGPNHSGTASNTIPPASPAGATFDVGLIYHNTGQSNGNGNPAINWCKVAVPADPNNQCTTPALFIPGDVNTFTDSIPLFTVTKTTAGTVASTPPPLSMLQPY